MRKIAPLKRVVQSTKIQFFEKKIKEGKIVPTQILEEVVPRIMSTRDINEYLKHLSDTNGVEYVLSDYTKCEVPYYMDLNNFIFLASIPEEELNDLVGYYKKLKESGEEYPWHDSSLVKEGETE